MKLHLSLPNLYNSHQYGSTRYPNYAAYWNQKEEAWLDKMEELGGFLLDLERQLGLGVPAHHINGTVFTQHESPQEQAAIKFGGLAEEWLVLLNVDSIGAFNFGDVGTSTYCIHKKDLAIQNFSAINVNIESS